MDVIHSIPQMIHHWAQHEPEALALVEPLQESIAQAPTRPNLNYDQLLGCSHQLVTQLNNLGLNRQDRVVVVLPNGVDMAMAFMAIAAGTTCVPLHPDYPSEEYEVYFSTLNAQALIIQPGVGKPAKIAAQAQGIPVLELTPQLDDETDLPTGLFYLKGASISKINAPIWAKPDDVALILPTAGTTSSPKMVALTHRNLCASAQNIADTLALTTADRCLNVMPLFHIHGLIGCVLSSLMAGGSVICTPGFREAQFLGWLQETQPTWYSAIPTIHQSVLDQAQHQGVPDSPLRFIRSASAALSARIMIDLEITFNVPVLEAYGMTEAAHQITTNPLPPALRKPGSVGVPGKTTVAIAAVDANKLLSQGEQGEVVIRGAAVTEEYVDNSVATAFFDGWFRTGDQGYLDNDGYLFLQGRLTEVVNRGGENVSPLDVDEVLMALPDVRQAVAFAYPHPILGEDLAAAVVPKPEAEITSETLRDYLFTHVAAVKVPSKIIFVDAIPKGPTGQLQRSGLATQLADQLTVEFIAPNSPVERSVTAVMGEILRCDRISVSDNFFVLGGNSLQATQVASRLSAQFKVNLPNKSLYRYPTVAKLADKITRLTTDNDGLVQGILAQLEGLPPEEIERLLATG